VGCRGFRVIFSREFAILNGSICCYPISNNFTSSNLDLRMAKKGKSKKAGMVHRQQQKQHKKALQRHKTMARRPGSSVSSQRLQQLLHALPRLAFAPELSDLRMDTQQLDALQQENLPEPIQVMRLLTPEFLGELDQCLAQVEEASRPQSPNHMLAKATRHQLDNSEKIPHLSNPLLIALYLRTQAALQGSTLEADELYPGLRDFESRNNEFIEQIAEDPDLLKNAMLALEGEGVSTSEAATATAQGEGFFQSLSGQPETDARRIREDVELFLEDFEAPAPTEWTPATVGEFVVWFMEEANPVQDDLQSIQSSLGAYLGFLASTGVLDSENATALQEELKRKIKDAETQFAIVS
jgi:hypothetical protein